jgi:hypothetical protein
VHICRCDRSCNDLSLFQPSFPECCTDVGQYCNTPAPPPTPMIPLSKAESRIVDLLSSFFGKGVLLHVLNSNPNPNHWNQFNQFIG